MRRSRESEYAELRAAMIDILETSRKLLHKDKGHFCDHRRAVQSIKDKAKRALGNTMPSVPETSESPGERR